MLVVVVTALMVVIVGAVRSLTHPLNMLAVVVKLDVVVSVPTVVKLVQSWNACAKVVAALKFRSGTVSRLRQPLNNCKAFVVALKSIKGIVRMLRQSVNMV
jgi:hypothetical protein